MPDSLSDPSLLLSEEKAPPGRLSARPNRGSHSGGAEAIYEKAGNRQENRPAYALFLVIGPYRVTPPPVGFSDTCRISRLSLYRSVSHTGEPSDGLMSVKEEDADRVHASEQVGR